MQNNNLLKNFEKFGDLFTLLGLAPNANKKEIKRAYKEKALIYHPDKNKAKDAGLFLVIDNKF
jgi:curved DNA-binding protein CbpA